MRLQYWVRFDWILIACKSTWIDSDARIRFDCIRGRACISALSCVLFVLVLLLLLPFALCMEYVVSQESRGRGSRVEYRNPCVGGTPTPLIGPLIPQCGSPVCLGETCNAS